MTLSIARKMVLIGGFALFFTGILMPARALRAQNWLDRANEGGLNAVGSEAYGSTGAPEKSLEGIIASLIKVFLGLLGVIFLIMIIMGGFKWMTAGGSEEKIKEAVSYIKNGMIGLLIILCAFSIATFISNRVVPKIITNSR